MPRNLLTKRLSSRTSTLAPTYECPALPMPVLSPFVWTVSSTERLEVDFAFGGVRIWLYLCPNHYRAGSLERDEKQDECYVCHEGQSTLIWRCLLMRECDADADVDSDADYEMTKIQRTRKTPCSSKK